jgi:hypothetical protein
MCGAWHIAHICKCYLGDSVLCPHSFKDIYLTLGPSLAPPEGISAP